MTTTSNAQTQRGFTLFELMIASALGLIIMLSAAYLAGQILRAATLDLEQSDLNDTKEVVNETIETDFKQAGNYLYRVMPAAAAATGYADEVTADTPYLWYRLDDPASSISALDKSGNNYMASVSGTVTFGNAGALASDPNPAATIAGRSSGYITGPNFGTPPADFTIEWWLNPTTLANNNQFLTTNTANTTSAFNTWSFFSASDGSVYCGTDQATALDPTNILPGTIQVNRWQHLVYTYSSGYGSLYLNGRLLASKQQNAPSGWNTLSLSDIQGGIDEVAIYYQALTPERIRAHYIAAVAPPIPQDPPGVKTPLLPLARWSATGSVFQRPTEPISLDDAGQSALLLSADDQFSPVTTDGSFVANNGALITRTGTRATPQAGDILFVIDYVGNQSALIRVTGDPQITTGSDGTDRWTIPIASVTTDTPAWGTLASDNTDFASPLPTGSTVVRLNAPVIYTTYTTGTIGILTRTIGNRRQTLALGAAGFNIQKEPSSTPVSWTVSYQLESEEIESSTDPNYKQLGTASLKLTPKALNPATR